LYAFIAAKKDHCLSELELLKAPIDDDLGYDMQNEFMDDEEYDPDLALAVMLSMQDQHGPGPSTSIEGSESSSRASGSLSRMLEDSDLDGLPLSSLSGVEGLGGISGSILGSDGLQ
jgi:hypothetical protein